MPELPEVETTLRGISPHIQGKTVVSATVHQTKLRWPVPEDLNGILQLQNVLSCSRRAKYLIIRFQTGILLIHLGMSGSLRIFRQDKHTPPGKHDHIDLLFDDGTLLRYHDPRRFGAFLWYPGAVETHPLLTKLGPEPLDTEFNAGYLAAALHKRKGPIKSALMDNAVVVGVGNIYANESLFLAGIAPNRPASSLTAPEIALLTETIRSVLQRAIEKGGSTLRDFVDSEGKSGYFQQEYRVYGRHRQPCLQCGTPIEKSIIGQRGTFYCPHCQQ